MPKTKPRPPGGPLNDSLTHLLHRVLQRALDFHTEAAGPGAITQRQYTVLAAAAGRDGQTQSDLVRATGIDRSTLADLVARLLAKGLLTRKRSSIDARANLVSLSQAGQAALAAGAAPASAADERLLGQLSAKKREALLKTLAAIAQVGDEVRPRPKKNKAKGRKSAVAPDAPAKPAKRPKTSTKSRNG